MEQGEEKRLAALDRMNGVACLLVILIHVLSLGISGLQADSWQLFVVFMPWRLSSFVVPLFLFTGAVKQVMHFSEKPLTLAAYASYLKGRFFRVLLPYMMWVAVYYAYCYRIGFVKGSVEEFLGYLRLGNLSSHFYYIIIVLQFYLLLPLWMWMVKRIPAYAALCGAALVTIFMLSFLGLLHLFGASMAYVDRLFLSYLFFWVLGLYAGKHAAAVLDGLSKKGRVLPAVLLLICAGMAYVSHRGILYWSNFDAVKLVADTLAIGLLLSCCLRVEAQGRLDRLLGRIHEASFSVYLSHCLFMLMATRQMERWGVESAAVLLLGRMLVCYTVPFGLYALEKRCRRALRRG